MLCLFQDLKQEKFCKEYLQFLKINLEIKRQ